MTFSLLFTSNSSDFHSLNCKQKTKNKTIKNVYSAEDLIILGGEGTLKRRAVFQ